MQKKTIATLLGLSGATLIGGLAIADHLPVDLSHVSTGEILTRVVYFQGPDNFGIPPYRASRELDDHETFDFAAGDSFTVIDQDGASETVVFEAAGFDHGVAAEHVASFINEKSSMLEGEAENSYLVLRGEQGGDEATLELIDGVGSPLARLGLDDPGAFAGGRDIRFELSVPSEGGHGHGEEGEGGHGADDHTSEHEHEHEHPPAAHELAFAPYYLLVSETEGSTRLFGRDVPIAFDGVTDAFFRAAGKGALVDFYNWLDENGDRSAVLPERLLRRAFDGDLPDELYFVFVVLNDELSEVRHVSNRFTVDFVE